MYKKKYTKRPIEEVLKENDRLTNILLEKKEKFSKVRWDNGWAKPQETNLETYTNWTMIFGEERKERIVTKYLEWKGWKDAWYFTYYDKDKWENVVKEIKSFIILKKGYTVKWYSEQNNSFIYSNEVEMIGQEEMNVRTHSWKTIATGIYKDIKWDILSAWGKLHIALTVMLDNKEVIQFFLKGQNFFNFTEIMNTIDINNHKITFEWAEDMKKWANKYKAPIFVQWEAITAEERAKASEIAPKLRKDVEEENKQIQEEISDEKAKDVDEEDLPFN